MTKRFRFAMLVVALLVFAGVAAHSRQAASAARTARGDYAIRAVLASHLGSEFRYFARSAGTASCAIPFVFRSVKGTCSIRVAPRPGFSGQVFVNLSERWSWRAFHYTGTPRGPLRHHWVFDLLPSGKVILARQTGDFPPNYAR